MKLSLVILSVLSGPLWSSCGGALGVQGATHIEVQGMDTYVERVLSIWSEELDDAAVEQIRPKVLWVEKDQCPGLPGVQIKWDGGCYNGLSFSAGGITCTIFLAYAPTLSTSSLAHELLHCSLHVADWKDGDSEHTHPLWKKVNDVR